MTKEEYIGSLGDGATFQINWWNLPFKKYYRTFDSLSALNLFKHIHTENFNNSYFLDSIGLLPHFGVLVLSTPIQNRADLSTFKCFQQNLIP